MPILGLLPVLPGPPAVVDPFADTRQLALRSLDGENLIPFTGAEFIAQWGMQGMDVPPRDVVLDEVPGMDGARIADVKIGARTVLLPIWFGSDSDHIDYLNRRDGLRALFNYRGVDLRSVDGSFDLVATSRDGTVERSLRCMYVSGMDGDWQRDTTGSYWESVGLNLLACRTYWYGEPWTTPTVRLPAAAKWFGQFPPQLSSSRALGGPFQLNVPGDVPSWARIDLVGPATTVTLTAPGLSVSIPAGLGTGERATVVTSPRGRTALFEGVKDWARIGAVTRWQPLPPGPTSITVVMTGATSVSSAVVSGDALYESPW